MTDFKAAESKRGFASMTPEKQREIASLGGRTAHQSGRAHEFTSEQARIAGRKGAEAKRLKKEAAAREAQFLPGRFDKSLSNEAQAATMQGAEQAKALDKAFDNPHHGHADEE